MGVGVTQLPIMIITYGRKRDPFTYQVNEKRTHLEYQQLWKSTLWVITPNRWKPTLCDTNTVENPPFGIPEALTIYPFGTTHLYKHQHREYMPLKGVIDDSVHITKMYMLGDTVTRRRGFGTFRTTSFGPTINGYQRHDWPWRQTHRSRWRNISFRRPFLQRVLYR